MASGHKTRPWWRVNLDQHLRDCLPPRWEREGAGGWSYESCLPYFRKAQTHSQGEDEYRCGKYTSISAGTVEECKSVEYRSPYRGGSGPLHVSRGASGNPLHEAWLEAGQQVTNSCVHLKCWPDMKSFVTFGAGGLPAHRGYERVPARGGGQDGRHHTQGSEVGGC